MRPPRVLYKYLTSERLDVLEHRRIRVTQSAGFNDPFESYPFIGDLPGSGSLQGSVDDVFRAHQRGQCVSSDTIQDAFLHTFMNRVGVLALAENPASIVMWAHYANNHDGYLIGFDTADKFFQPSAPYARVGDGMTLDELRAVEYRHKRPETGFSFVFGDDAPFIKSPDWAYEQEWRIRKHLEGAVQVLNEDAPFPVYLFAFPATAVSEVVIGCRVPSPIRSRLLDVIGRADYQHVNVLQAWPHPTQFGMQLLPHDRGNAMPDITKQVITDVPPDKVEQTMQLWANMGAAQIDRIRQADGKWTVVVVLRE